MLELNNALGMKSSLFNLAAKILVLPSSHLPLVFFIGGKESVDQPLTLKSYASSSFPTPEFWSARTPSFFNSSGHVDSSCGSISPIYSQPNSINVRLLNFVSAGSGFSTYLVE